MFYNMPMRKFLGSIILSTLRILSKIQLKKINPKIIGVGGSSGKTSTAHIISLILKQKYKVRETEGKNSESGIPLSILGLNPRNYRNFDWIIILFQAFIKVLTDFKKYDVLIVEMGIDGPLPPKNMDYLLKIVKPNVSVLTNVALEHSVYFEQEGLGEKEILNLIKTDETRLIRQIDEKSVAVVNLDDKNTREYLDQVRASKLTVSAMDQNSDFFISKYSVSVKNTLINFVYDKQEYSLSLSTPLPNFYAYSFMFSIAVAKAIGVGIGDSTKTIEKKFSLPPGRLSVFDGINGSTIIDSSYNNSLEAIDGILELMSAIGKGRRKVGIIGDIREQGKQSQRIHEQMAESIIKNLDKVILIGPLVGEFVAHKLKQANVSYEKYETFTQARSQILKLPKNNDLILVKGSQNTLLLERAVEILLKNKADTVHLCRREKFWEKQRKITP